MSNLSSFRAVYDDLTDEVMRAQYRFVPEHLRRWFEALDDTPDVARILARLEEGLSFPDWWGTANQNYNNTGGKSGLRFSDHRAERLGMKLLLFRAMAKELVDIAVTGQRFAATGNENINVTAQAFTDQVFRPFARELRRLLEEELSSATTAPAADRVVRLDHNSASYRDAIDAVENLEKVIKEGNDFADVDVRDQRVAEVSAIRRLLEPVLMAIAPIAALLKPLLIQIAKGVKDNLVNIAVSAVVTALGTLLGYLFS